MKITIIGTGYVGLVTGACLSNLGNEVWCVDKNEENIKKLQDGVLPIYEPGLEPLVKRGIKAKCLFFTTQLKETPQDCDIYFLTVDTPSQPDGTPHLGNIFAAAEAIGNTLTNHCLIVLKSTVPVGTTFQVKKTIEKKLEERGLDRLTFSVASNPEFLKEGSSVQDFCFPDRLVIGVETTADAEKLRELYAPLIPNPHRFLVMDIPSAELTKYIANAMLATRISFMNEMSNLCENVGADIDKIREAIGFDHRIGPHFLFPGLGYGGSCLPKDLSALLQLGKTKSMALPLLQAVDAINQKQRKLFLEKILAYFRSPEQVRGKKIAFWGISFKPETDDIRESPAVYLIWELVKRGATLQVFDPVAMEKAKRAFSGCSIAWMSNPYACLEKADALVIATEWSEFRSPDFTKMKQWMQQPVIFDGRNLYSPDKMKQLGFQYWSIGR